MSQGHVSSPSKVHRCGFCKWWVKTSAGVRLHIQNTYSCHHQWEAWLAIQSTWRHNMLVTEPQSSAMQLDSGLSNEPTMDLSLHADLIADLDATQRPSYKAYVEDAPDEDEANANGKCFIRSYPRCESEVFGKGMTVFEQWRTGLEASKKSRWVLFTSQEEWKLAQWLNKCAGHNQIEEFLKLPIMSMLSNCYSPNSL